MATKRKDSRLKIQDSIEPKQEVVWTQPPVTKVEPKTKREFPKWVLVVGVVALAILAWWWRTNTWPVVAMVGSKPVTRFEIEQSLFKQYGQATIDGIVTQYQIESQLDKQGVMVDSKEVDARVEEIKKSLGAGQDLDTELKSRGMDVEKFKGLIALQLRLNKAVEGKATISAEQVTAYVKENGQFLSGKTDAEKKVEAEAALKQDAQSAEIDKWVTDAKKAISVWRLYPEPTAPAGTSGQTQVTQ